LGFGIGDNRLEACARAKVEPRFEDFEGTDEEALAFVLSLNAARRDLTGAQRAMVAVRLWILSQSENGFSKGGRPKKGKPFSGKEVSLGQLEQLFRTAKKSMIACRDLLEGAPDLAEKVSQNMLYIKEACAEMEQRAQAAVQEAENAKRASKFAEKISRGEMTYKEAIQNALEEAQYEKEKEASIADARPRRTWLQELDHCCHWLETYVAKSTDDALTCYTLPDSPGLYDHGITRQRLMGMIAQDVS
jgi:hypothetical protein